MNAVNKGGKKEEREWAWEATLNQRDYTSFPDTCLV